MMMQNDLIAGLSGVGQHYSEQDETTRMSERQHILNSTSGAQPNDSVIIEKKVDNKHQERDLADRDSKEAAEPAVESVVKKVLMPQELPSVLSPPRIKMDWNCKGCGRANSSTANYRASCSHHNTQKWVKMIYCDYCSDGPYLAANHDTCANCFRLFNGGCRTVWRPGA